VEGNFLPISHNVAGIETQDLPIIHPFIDSIKLESSSKAVFNGNEGYEPASVAKIAYKIPDPGSDEIPSYNIMQITKSNGKTRYALRRDLYYFFSSRGQARLQNNTSPLPAYTLVMEPRTGRRFRAADILERAAQALDDGQTLFNLQEEEAKSLNMESGLWYGNYDERWNEQLSDALQAFSTDKRYKNIPNFRMFYLKFMATAKKTMENGETFDPVTFWNEFLRKLEPYSDDTGGAIG